MLVASDHVLAADFERHAASEQIDRDDEPTLLLTVGHEDALDTREGPVHYAHPVAVLQQWGRKYRDAGFDDVADRVDVRFGHRRQTRPAVLEHPHDAAHAEHLDVSLFGHGISNEEVPRKHRRDLALVARGASCAP